MRTWYEWSMRRHLNVAWRWASVATVVLIAPTQIMMQGTYWPWELPQNILLNAITLYLIFLLSYLTVAVVSKLVVEEKAKEKPKDSLAYGLSAGTILSFFLLCATGDPNAHYLPIVVLTLFGGLYAIGLGFALGSVTPEEKLKEGDAGFLFFPLSCGLILILALSIGLGPGPLLVILLGLLLITAISFGLTKVVRFLNRRNVWSSIGSWLIAG